VNGVSRGSRTNEDVHFSVRVKMEESTVARVAEKVGEKRVLRAPSRALEGYVFDGERRAWVCGRRGRPELREVELPMLEVSVEGVESENLEAWIFSEWLQKQAKSN